VTTFLRATRKFIVKDEAASMVEYALMLALIAVVCLVVIGQVGTSAQSVFTSVSSSL
jgi:pilus assembly protein Flp/PilA